MPQILNSLTESYKIDAIIRKIKIIQFLLEKKESAKKINILIAWYQHASDITYPILENTTWTISYVISIWM